MPEREQVMMELLETAATSLLEAMAKKEHELTRCSKAIQTLMREGVAAARAGMLDQATEKFYRAAEQDPKFVGARVQLIKAYIAQDRDLEALVMGGFALTIASDPRSRCRIYNFMGQISQELFQQTRSSSHLSQAVSFYERAREADFSDILPAWNLVDVHVLAHTLGFTKEDARIMEKARHHFRSVLEMARAGSGNAAHYLPAIISEAETKLPQLEDSWWTNQLGELQQCATLQPWQEAPVMPGVNYKKLAKAVALSVLMSSLAYAIHQGPPKPARISPKSPPAISMPHHPGRGVLPSPARTDVSEALPPLPAAESPIGLYTLEGAQLASTGHDWGDIVVKSLGHDWGDLTKKKSANWA